MMRPGTVRRLKGFEKARGHCRNHGVRQPAAGNAYIQYEEGTKLVKICQEKLAEAELKIQQLEKSAAGEMKLKPRSPDLSEE